MIFLFDLLLAEPYAISFFDADTVSGYRIREGL